MQGELFQGIEKNIRHPEELEDEKLIEKTSVFERFQVTLTLDKLAIISISLMVLLAVTFAMGVERGKQKAVQANTSVSAESAGKTVIQQEWSRESQETPEESLADTTLVSETTESENLNSLPPAQDLTPPIQIQTKPTKQVIEEQNKRYTIRLASYLKRAPAKHTADKLKKKGYDTFIKQSGKYIVLNVGRFSEKQEAYDALLRLRKELRIGKEGFILSV